METHCYGMRAKDTGRDRLVCETFMQMTNVCCSLDDEGDCQVDRCESSRKSHSFTSVWRGEFSACSASLSGMMNGWEMNWREKKENKNKKFDIIANNECIQMGNIKHNILSVVMMTRFQRGEQWGHGNCNLITFYVYIKLLNFVSIGNKARHGSFSNEEKKALYNGSQTHSDIRHSSADYHTR